jgi:hypothetical protein
VFDPERDDDPGPRRFYLRLLTVVVISAAGCLALWPSVTGFGAGPDHDTSCLAVANGWHADRAGSTASEIAAFNRVFPPPPTPAQGKDPAAMARWHAQFAAAQQNPVVQRAYAYDAWVNGPGACVRESRHRLIHSGIALAALAAFCLGIAYTRRTRTNLRKHPAELAGT